MTTHSCLSCPHPYALHYAEGKRQGTYAAVRNAERLTVASVAVTGRIRCRVCRGSCHLSTEK